MEQYLGLGFTVTVFQRHEVHVSFLALLLQVSLFLPCLCLISMRSSSKASLNSCGTSNRSLTISVIGNDSRTASIIGDDRSQVIFLTLSLLQAGIDSSNKAVISDTLVPKSSATNVTRLPWTSLFVTLGKSSSLLSAVSSMLRYSPQFSGKDT